MSRYSKTKEKMNNQELVKDNKELDEIRSLLPRNSAFSGLTSLTFLAIVTSLLASISSIAVYIITSIMLVFMGINLIIFKNLIFVRKVK